MTLEIRSCELKKEACGPKQSTLPRAHFAFAVQQEAVNLYRIFIIKEVPI